MKKFLVSFVLETQDYESAASLCDMIDEAVKQNTTAIVSNIDVVEDADNDDFGPGDLTSGPSAQLGDDIPMIPGIDNGEIVEESYLSNANDLNSHITGFVCCNTLTNPVYRAWINHGIKGGAQ